MIGAGELSERWELQGKTRVRTASGGIDVTWLTERKVWCKIESAGSSIRQEADAREPQSTHKVTARLEGGDITPEKRLLKGTRTLMIAGNVLNVDEADCIVQFNAIEGVAT